MTQDDNIVFTDRDKLNEYNTKLLEQFIHYLNERERKRYDVFDCGASTHIIKKTTT